MGPKVRVQWGGGSGPKSLRRMNHIPEKASLSNPYTAAAARARKATGERVLIPQSHSFPFFLYILGHREQTYLLGQLLDFKYFT